MERLYLKISYGTLVAPNVENHEGLPLSNTAQKMSMQEAKLAKEKMHGRLACGRPLMVRLASEKYLEEAAAQNSSKAGCNTIKSGTTSTISGQVSRSAKIAAIKNKLKALDEERDGAKKPKAS
ncbi:hypothetical protein ERO13_D11G011001v2 [Gossypium hirsutum]|nr:hypothetical protein ERO13_D11G011001v2 [Gossypium hirsutum]